MAGNCVQALLGEIKVRYLGADCWLWAVLAQWKPRIVVELQVEILKAQPSNMWIYSKDQEQICCFTIWLCLGDEISQEYELSKLGGKFVFLSQRECGEGKISRPF